MYDITKKWAISMAPGLIYVTGPAESGKSTLGRIIVGKPALIDPVRRVEIGYHPSTFHLSNRKDNLKAIRDSIYWPYNPNDPRSMEKDQFNDQFESFLMELGIDFKSGKAINPSQTLFQHRIQLEHPEADFYDSVNFPALSEGSIIVDSVGIENGKIKKRARLIVGFQNLDLLGSHSVPVFRSISHPIADRLSWVEWTYILSITGTPMVSSFVPDWYLEERESLLRSGSTLSGGIDSAYINAGSSLNAIFAHSGLIVAFEVRDDFSDDTGKLSGATRLYLKLETRKIVRHRYRPMLKEMNPIESAELNRIQTKHHKIF